MVVRQPDEDPYLCLGIPRDADLVVVRAAYRRLARELHPDLVGVDGRADPERQRRMASVNDAWSLLSDPTRRAAYDRAISAQRVAETAAGRASPVFRAPTPGRPGVGLRREAWVQSVRVRIRFLGALAGRSAVQTLLVRHPGTGRTDWEARVDPILDLLAEDTEERLRTARKAGAAPLDLANAALLLGLREIAARSAAEARRRGADAELLHRAELVDRMFATLAHELPFELVRALGDSPRAVRSVRSSR